MPVQADQKNRHVTEKQQETLATVLTERFRQSTKHVDNRVRVACPEKYAFSDTFKCA